MALLITVPHLLTISVRLPPNLFSSDYTLIFVNPVKEMTRLALLGTKHNFSGLSLMKRRTVWFFNLVKH